MWGVHAVTIEESKHASYHCFELCSESRFIISNSCLAVNPRSIHMKAQTDLSSIVIRPGEMGLAIF